MKYLSVGILLLAGLLAAQVSNAQDCGFDRSAQPFFRIGAGWTGRLDHFGDSEYENGELAADLSIGVRWPVSRHHVFDITLSDNSYWFVGEPFNDDEEDTRHHLNVGYEYRF